MIKLGPIKKIFRHYKLLIYAWVSDNSPLKSIYPVPFGNRIAIGKGYDKITDSYRRLAITRWSIYTTNKGVTTVWIGIGKFTNGKTY